MKIDDIVEGACARAMLEFQENVELEANFLMSPKGGGWSIPIAEVRAMKKFLPSLLSRALTITLTNIQGLSLSDE